MHINEDWNDVSRQTTVQHCQKKPQVRSRFGPMCGSHYYCYVQNQSCFQTDKTMKVRCRKITRSGEVVISWNCKQWGWNVKWHLSKNLFVTLSKKLHVRLRLRLTCVANYHWAVRNQSCLQTSQTMKVRCRKLMTRVIISWNCKWFAKVHHYHYSFSNIGRRRRKAVGVLYTQNKS